MTFPIKSEDISIIVTGLWTKYTKNCLLSIKQYYPASHLIVSTWSSETLFRSPENRKMIDVLIESDENTMEKFNNFQNFSRIIHASKVGLAVVDTKYSIRIRSDIVFVSNQLMNNWNVHDLKPDSEFCIFEQKIRALDLGSMMHRGMPFYFADICQAGLTSDIKKFFDVDLIPVTLKKWQVLFPKIKEGFPFNHYDLGNEHAIPMMVITKHLGHRFNSPFEMDKNEKSVHDSILLSNFSLLTKDQWGIFWEKHPNYGKGIKSYYVDLYGTIVDSKEKKETK